MDGQYTYTPYIIPTLTVILSWSALGFYIWRRSIPGALFFTALEISVILWSFGAAMEVAAVDLSVKIFWFKFKTLWAIPALTAEFCFGLEYAGFGRFLTRRNLAFVSLFVLAYAVTILTDDMLHWVWQGFSFEGYVRANRTPLGSLFLIYTYLLAPPLLIIYIRLFLRSPRNRLAAAILVFQVLSLRVMALFGRVLDNPFAPLDPPVLAFNIAAVLYAVALFGFGMFDPIPLARRRVIEQMQEGMLVLDTAQRIVDLNPATERFLGLPGSRLRGRDLADVLPGHAEMSENSNDGNAPQFEVTLGNGAARRSYTLRPSPLTDRDGQTLGYLILLHDVTGQKQAQAQLMEQQKVVATLQERERLARDLHDSLGQVLSAVSMQANAARKLFRDGQAAEADTQLSRLSSIAENANADVREFILNLRMGPSPQQPFIPFLRQYLHSFSMQYDISTSLAVPDGFEENCVAPEARLHLFRIVQEALSNARRHAAAKSAWIKFECENHRVRVVIQDDGCGFDPGTSSARKGFGLAFMRERAEQMGGCLDIQSEPRAGTRVTVEVPLR